MKTLLRNLVIAILCICLFPLNVFAFTTGDEYQSTYTYESGGTTYTENYTVVPITETFDSVELMTKEISESSHKFLLGQNNSYSGTRNNAALPPYIAYHVKVRTDHDLSISERNDITVSISNYQNKYANEILYRITSGIYNISFSNGIWEAEIKINRIPKSNQAHTESDIQNFISETDEVVDNLDYYLPGVDLETATDYEKALAVYRYVQRNMIYHAGIAYTDVIDVFHKHQGICGSYEILYRYFLRKVGLECYPVDGYLGSITANNVHVWDAVKIGDKFYFIDGTGSAGLVGMDYLNEKNVYSGKPDVSRYTVNESTFKSVNGFEFSDLDVSDTDYSCERDRKGRLYMSDCKDNHEWVEDVYPYYTSCWDCEYISYKCTKCGMQYEDVPDDWTGEEVGHLYDEGTHYDATCTEKGMTVYKCTRLLNEGTPFEILCCDSNESGSVEIVYDPGSQPLGHDWDTIEYDFNNLTATRRCKREGCGEVETAELTKTLTPIQERSCTQDGIDKYNYTGAFDDGTLINKEETITIPGGHDYTMEWDFNEETEKFEIDLGCKNCNYSSKQYIAGTIVSSKEPTCVEAGYKNYECTSPLDGEEKLTYKATFEATGEHDLQESITTPATCTEAGSKHVSCNTCDYEADIPIPKLGHEGGKATCIKKAVCTRCHEEYGDYDPDNHENTEVVGAKDATCTADGYTGDLYCNDCKKTVEKGSDIPSKGGHKYTSEVTEQPKCTAEGVRTYTCSECGDTYTEPVEALGHKGGTATCKHKAVCERCGQEYGELDPDRHAEGSVVTVPGKAPTCTADGYTASSYCSDCNKTISEKTTIDRLGHIGGTATCIHMAVCERCKEEYGELDPDNHTGETEVRNSVEASCIAKGYTGDTYCLDCNCLTNTGTEIPMLDHLYETSISGGYIINTCIRCLDVVKTPIKVTKVTINGLSHKIAAGKKVALKAAVTPTNALNKAVTWKSSNTKVATVTSTGVVTVKAKTGGKTVTITATAKDGSGVKGTYKITSMKGVVTKVALSGSTYVKNGRSITLKAKVTATTGANKTLKWTSSNTKYATVSSKGVVKGLKAGKGKYVTITAAATDGSGKKATKKIKVK